MDKRPLLLPRPVAHASQYAPPFCTTFACGSSCPTLPVRCCPTPPLPCIHPLISNPQPPTSNRPPRRSLDEVIGRADLLAQRPVKLAKTDGLDLSFLTTYAGPSAMGSNARRSQEVHSNGPVLDDRILADPEVMDAIVNEKVGTCTRARCGRGCGWEPSFACACLRVSAHARSGLGGACLRMRG